MDRTTSNTLWGLEALRIINIGMSTHVNIIIINNNRININVNIKIHMIISISILINIKHNIKQLLLNYFHVYKYLYCKIQFLQHKYHSLHIE